MGKYSLSWEGHTTATDTTLQGGFILMTAGAMCEIVEFVMTGSGGNTAADSQHRALGHYFDGTCTGANTSRDPQKLAPFMTHDSDVSNSGVLNTTQVQARDASEYVIVFGFNQRGGMRWAVPLGEGVVVNGDDTDDDGFGAAVISGAAGLVDGMLQWHEP